MKRYQLDYRENDSRRYMTHEFEARNDAEAQLYAERFCDEGWHKLYGVLRLK